MTGGVGGRLTAVLLGAVVLLAVLAGPASAHTALLSSSPEPGARLAYAPEEVVLTFAAPVSVDTVSAVVRTDGGAPIELEVATTGGSATVVVFEVPPLPRDIYGLTWQSVGPDGHRVTGEVVFGVGLEPGASTSVGGATQPVARLLDVLAATARVVWYLGLAAAAAAVVLRRRPGLIADAAGRRMPSAWVLLAVGATLRGILGVITFVQAGGAVGDAVASRPTLLWLALAAVLVLPPTHRWAGGGRWRAAALLGAAVVVGTLAGHAPTRPDPLLAITFGAVHVGAAALWVGPVLGLALVSRSAAWRQLGATARKRELREVMLAIVAVAGWALAAVSTSGVLLALRAWDGGGEALWSRNGATSSGFVIALIAKAAVVALIAVPLGAVHHRRRTTVVRVPRTVGVEAVALVVALALGSVLVGVDPGWGGRVGGADPALAALLDGGTDDPAACAELDVGRASCYRMSLEAVLVDQGPQEAIAQLTALSTTDDYVTSNCHQVAHDLGNDAAGQIQDMGQALAVEASVCWSGYYHGFVEARLSDIPDDELTRTLPSFCDGAADPRYSFTHYNCLHGLGHGLMLRVDAGLFDALPLCEQSGEGWAVKSCASGVFMENVMAAQQGEATATFDDSDLLYPCTEVEGIVTEDCYLMQTSHILWRLNGDIAGGFAWCDTAPADYQDTCYRSMGRDISSRAALDPQAVVDMCATGREDLVRWCLDGASSNAVYELAEPSKADALCALVEGDRRDACTAARDQAVATVSAG